jgi:hypothetical protein
MGGTKSSTKLTIIAIVISLISLFSSFGVLGVSQSVKGLSIKENKVWRLSIDDVSKLATDNEFVEIIKEPEFKKYNVSYGVNFKKIGSSQFEFLVKNEGDFDALVSDIVIAGLEQYEEYVEIEFVNLNIGDVIKKESYVTVKVITSCHTQLFDMNLIEKEIMLDNIGVDIKLQKIE